MCASDADNGVKDDPSPAARPLGSGSAGVLVERRTGVTLVGGGELGPATLSVCLGHAPSLIAADGGAVAALDCGFTPEATLGDLDSLPAAARVRLPGATVHRIAEQDTTDFHKCLRHVAAPFFLAAGFLAGRTDHTLAVLNALVRHAGAPCVLVGESDLVFHLRAPLSLALPAGTRVSLFAMRPVSGRSQGLRWPIENLRFAPDGMTGTSNETTGADLELHMDGWGMLCMLPRMCLGCLLPALGLVHDTP